MWMVPTRVAYSLVRCTKMQFSTKSLPARLDDASRWRSPYQGRTWKSTFCFFASAMLLLVSFQPVNSHFLKIQLIVVLDLSCWQPFRNGLTHHLRQNKLKGSYAVLPLSMIMPKTTDSWYQTALLQIAAIWFCQACSPEPWLVWQIQYTACAGISKKLLGSWRR